MKPWGIDDAVVFLRGMASALAPVGWHVGLTGSVLCIGISDNDLDVVVYPRCVTGNRQPNIDLMRDALKDFGMMPLHDVDVVQAKWRRHGSRDTKHVEIWTAPDGRRVDLFVLS